MSALVLPRGFNEADRSALEAEAIEDLSLLQRYDHDRHFREWVDSLHNHRLGAPGACLPCMRVVALHHGVPEWRPAYSRE